MEMRKGIDPIEATRAIDRQTQMEWQKKYEPKAVKNFVKPAEICTLCGGPMHVDPENGTEYVINKRERKWSIHNYCFELAEDQLDRAESTASRRG